MSRLHRMPIAATQERSVILASISAGTTRLVPRGIVANHLLAPIRNLMTERVGETTGVRSGVMPLSVLTSNSADVCMY